MTASQKIKYTHIEQAVYESGTKMENGLRLMDSKLLIVMLALLLKWKNRSKKAQEWIS